MANTKDCTAPFDLPVPTQVPVPPNVTPPAVTAATVCDCNATVALAGAANSFCGEEAQLTNHACNSLHPAVSFDPSGNLGVVWTDTRDGVPATYFQIVASQIASSNLGIAEGSYYDPLTGRVVNPGMCPENGNMCLKTTSASGAETGGAATGDTSGGGSAITLGSGQLIVVNQTCQLLTPPGSVNFVSLAIRPGSIVRVLSGKNQNLTFTVANVQSETVLNLGWVANAVNDVGFNYSITGGAGVGPNVSTAALGEVRLNCGTSSALFPDVVSDKDGRFHVVYQDDKTGKFELYYIQVYSSKVGEKKCSGAVPAGQANPSDPITSALQTVSAAAFSQVPNGTPGSISVGGGTFMPTGDSGSEFSFGSRNPVLKPSRTGPVAARDGWHKLFRNFYFGGTGDWVGVSSADDRSTWEAQSSLIGSTSVPDYTVPAGNPIGDEGDFGTQFSSSSGNAFTDIAFMVQSPPDMSVKVSKIVLPIKPKCLPGRPAAAGTVVEQPVVPVPKRPVPPTFVDPIDLSGMLTSPLVTTDQLSPSRYTIEGDTTGTVFTNILVDDGRGNLNRLVFNCSPESQPEQPVFILGQRRCGEGYCALLPTPVAGAESQDTKAKYTVRLQVWEGPDYRSSATVPSSVAATLLIDREFVFGPSEDMSTFNFKDGELQLTEGKVVFLVPHAGSHVEFYAEGIGNGTDVWTTSGGSNFNQYDAPFTVPPSLGLKAPAYYDGILATAIGPAVEVGGGEGNGTATCYKITPLGSLNLASLKASASNITAGQSSTPSPNDIVIRPAFFVASDGSYAVAEHYSGAPLNLGPTTTITLFLTIGSNVFQGVFSQGDCSAGTGSVTDVTGQVFSAKSTDPGADFSTNKINDILISTTTECGTAWRVISVVSDTEVSVELLQSSCGPFPSPHVEQFLVSVNGIIRPVSATLTDQQVVPKTLPDTGKVLRGILSASAQSKTFMPTGSIVSVLKGVPTGPTSNRLFVAKAKVLGYKGNEAFLSILSPNAIISTQPNPLVFASGSVSVQPGGTFGILQQAQVTTLAQAQALLAVSPDNACFTLEGGSGWPTNLVGQTGTLVYNYGSQLDPSTSEVHWPFTVLGVQSDQAVLLVRSTAIASNMPNADTRTTFPSTSVTATAGAVHANITTIAPASCVAVPPSPTTTTPTTEEGCNYYSTQPLRLTNSQGNSTHPRLAKTKNDDIWLVFQSDRTGSNEVYVSKYFGKCGQWATSTSGGMETKLSAAGEKGAYAAFPGVAADSFGEAHVVWHSTETEDAFPDIFYSHSTSAGTKFLSPERVTASPSNAMMADVISFVLESSETQAVVWHDDRFGQYEIMAAFRQDGTWESSASGASDVRITQAKGDSLFPRIAADSQGNLRVVYHDYRNPPLALVYMSTYVSKTKNWEASGQGGQDVLVSTGGTDLSLHPDIDIDVSNSVYVGWHDTRLRATNPDWHEELFGSYCSRLDSTIKHYGPSQVATPAMYAHVDFKVLFADHNGNPMEFTNDRNAFLKITISGAGPSVFVRYVFESSSPDPMAGDGTGGWSPWQQFRPATDLDTTLVPVTLPPGNGKKRIYVQIQDSTTLSYPIWAEIVLQGSEARFRIELFKDEAMTASLPTFNGHPVASTGNIFVRLTSSEILPSAPTFDVVGRGEHLVRNRPTIAASGFSGTAGSSIFSGRFEVERDDGVFNVDGPAKVVPRYREAT